MPEVVSDGLSAARAMPKSVSTTRSSRADQDIRRLDVTVQNARGVRGAKRGKDPEAHLGRLSRRQRAVIPQDVAQ